MFWGIVLLLAVLFGPLLLIFGYVEIVALIHRIRFSSLVEWKKVRPAGPISASPAAAIATIGANLSPRSREEWERVLAAADELADIYLQADPAVRQGIVREFSGKKRVFLYVCQMASFKLRQGLEKAEAELVYRRGVAALYIDSLGDEFRDAMIELARLTSAGKKAGLDVDALNAELAQLEEEGKELGLGMFLTQKERGQGTPLVAPNSASA